MSQPMDIDSNDDVKSTIILMKQAVDKKDSASLKSSINSLQESAEDVVSFLVPILFEDGNILSSDEALTLVGCLVSINAPVYLKPISRSVKMEATLRASSEKSLVVSPQLLRVMVSQLKGRDVEVSANATDSLIACSRKLGSSLAGDVAKLTTDAWMDAWSNLDKDRNISSTICVRCASTMMELIALDDSFLQAFQSTKGTSLLVEMLTYDSDPLLQMSVLDLVGKSASIQPMHHFRANWLCSNEILSPLLKMAGADEDETPDPILGGPALRSLSAISRLGQRDSTLLSHEALLGFHKALQNFQCSGELDRLAMIDAISSFASASPEALELVLNDSATRESWLSLNVAQPKLKAVILTSISMVIDPVPERDASGDVIANTATLSNALAMRLFYCLGSTNSGQEDATAIVLCLAKSPMLEERLGAYDLMRAVAKTSQGAQVLLTHSGFFEFLVSREGESTKLGREKKFSVVEAVIDSPVKGLLANGIVKKLEQILKEGPHHVPLIRPDLIAE